MSENKTAKETIVENGTEFEGVVRSKCPIVVSGQLRGEVTAPSLTLKPEGSVHGKVKVSHLKSEGSLGGEIDAESVELSGSISDDTVIRTAALEVKLNQSAGSKLRVSFGNCELQVGEPATKAKPEMQGNATRKSKPGRNSPASTKNTINLASADKPPSRCRGLFARVNSRAMRPCQEDAAPV